MPTNPVLARLVDERDDLHRTIDNVLDAVQADERDPTDSERELIGRHRSRLSTLEPQIVELVELEEQRGAARDARAVLEPGGPRTTGGSSVNPTAPAGAGPPVYRSFGEFARDELIARYNLISKAAGPGSREAAVERLTRAVVNTITSDIPGALPPQHMAQILDVIVSSRPMISASRNVPLSSGKLTYPRITQRPVVGVQTAEKTDLPSQKMIVAMQEVTASTYGGSGDLSWQAINWSTPDALTLYFDLMAEAYAMTTETAVGTYIGSAHTGADVELLSDDFAGWYAAITAAAGNVYAASRRFADVIYAAPELAFHLAGLVTNQNAAFGAGGSINISQGGAGNIAGLRLIASHGLTGNSCFVGNSQSLLVAETPGAPVELRAVEPSIGGMEVGVIGAFAAELTDTTAFVAIVNVVPLATRTAPGTTPTATETPATPSRSGNGK
jgi:HK97 family phage major capsid protein